jgi:lipoyl(octanoyl) transferase
MDLEPFSRINPCGFQQLKMTQIADFEPKVDIKSAEIKLMDYLIANLGYNNRLVLGQG